MKLSTFLLLMQGKAWFPSVACLRSSDPLEGVLLDDLAPELISELMKFSDATDLDRWLINNLHGHMREFFEMNRNDPRLATNLLAEQYTKNLVRRRLAWCWFASDLESSAMWSIYGGQGVAVRTDVQSLQEALPSSKEFRIDSLEYVDRRPCSEKSLRATICDRPDLLFRPHLLKAIEYEHEKEVRVTAFCPEDVMGLVITGIDFQKLVKQVVISPLFPAAEFAAIREMVDTCQEGIGKLTAQSSLNGREDGGDFARSFEEQLFGESDEHLRLKELPLVLRSL
jgi:hypothetical protein